MPRLHLVSLRGVSIYRQLLLEEALFRTSNANFFLVNDGSRLPAIVLGLSGRGSELLHADKTRDQIMSLDHVKQHFHVHPAAPDPSPSSSPLALIRRYSGGGTVVVDHDTIFTTLILNAADVRVDCFPHPVMRYAASYFDPAFKPYGDFALRENDFVFGHQKFGGNAQAISKGRFVHHTSLLWDFHVDRMALLKNPKKQPKYRDQRNHEDFVTRLRHLCDNDREGVLQRLRLTSQQAGFEVIDMTLKEAEELVAGKEHLCGTKLLGSLDEAG